MLTIEGFMKSIKIISIFFITAFLGFNATSASQDPTHMYNAPSNISIFPESEPVSHSPFTIASDYTRGQLASPAGLTIQNLLENYPALSSGIDVILQIYSNSIIPDGKYDFCAYPRLRSVARFGHCTFSAAYEACKCLTIYHFDEPIYAKILIGISFGKAAFWAFNQHFERESTKNLAGYIDAYAPDWQLRALKVAMKTDVSEAITPLSNLAKYIVKTVPLRELSEPEVKMFKRLKELDAELNRYSWVKKHGLYGGKIVCVGAEIATGISAAVSGQKSRVPFLTTMTSTVLGSFFESFITYSAKIPIAQNFMLASEMLYLCRYFYQRLPEGNMAETYSEHI
jgi:hypothetical protein